MTIPPLAGGGAVPPLRTPILSAPIHTDVAPVGPDAALLRPAGAALRPDAAVTDEAPISLGGRLDSGDALPETTQLALALESATRAILSGRADQVLVELDAVWSGQLAADSPWYLRTAALQLLGRMTDAEQVMRDAIERLPRSAALLYLLGVFTSHRGHPDAARLANDHALALHPTEPLLWLQRAALARQSGMHDTASAILERVRLTEPSYPAAQWLSTLARLGDAATRVPTPGVQRALVRLTPSSMPAVSGDALASATSLTTPALESAVRYGLTLLDSPTQSARIATPLHTSVDPDVQYATMQVRADTPLPRRAELPSWESLTLAVSVVVLALVPPLRIPALMLCGAMTMLIVSRRIR
jgi:hypothetical protein